MKTIYFECNMGAAGDMLAAALIELLPNPDAFIKELNALGIPGVQVLKKSVTKCGIQGTHISVKINGEEENEAMHGYHHEHMVLLSERLYRRCGVVCAMPALRR